MNAAILEQVIRERVEKRIAPAIEKAYAAWCAELAKFGVDHYDVYYLLKPAALNWRSESRDDKKVEEANKAYQKMVENMVNKDLESLMTSVKAAAEIQSAAQMLLDSVDYQETK